MLRFPSGIHDDQVDGLAWNVQMVLDRSPPKAPKQKAVKSWRDQLNITGQGASHMAA
jgi:hypothetical protein